MGCDGRQWNEPGYGLILWESARFGFRAVSIAAHPRST
jgi:hypothetical protein